MSPFNPFIIFKLYIWCLFFSHRKIFFCRVGYFCMAWWKTGIAGMRVVKNNRQITFEIYILLIQKNVRSFEPDWFNGLFSKKRSLPTKIAKIQTLISREINIIMHNLKLYIMSIPFETHNILSFKSIYFFSSTRALYGCPPIAAQTINPIKKC